ncbi:MAG: CotH kinase family protein [Lachnospiraceae bacterium]|nr:CotH kinase family protein [Lachnospiraceae bacterium]
MSDLSTEKQCLLRNHIKLLLLAAILGVAALAGSFLSPHRSEEFKERPTLGYSDEEILTLPYFDILAPKGENHNLLSDVSGYSLGDGFIHLYLPDNIPEESVIVYIRDIDGNYLARRQYDFTQKVMIGPWEVLLERHNLPILYFDCDDPGVYADMNSRKTKDVICPGSMHISSGDGDLWGDMRLSKYWSVISAGTGTTAATLQGRGVSSWSFCDTKKSYSLRLDRPRDLLGMGSNRNWNLVGNAFDVSLLKSMTFNRISRDIGIAYQPNMQYVNLYVDGKYQGVYMLTTKVTVDENRVALGKGDYFYQKFSTNREQPFSYTSDTWYDDGQDFPEAELLYPENASAEELQNAANVFQNFIDTLEDPSSGNLADVCDIRSLAKYYWIQEASMNFDGWERCVYMYYTKPDGRMHFGPVWDMDLTLGATDQKLGIAFDTPEGWRIRNGGWYTKLFENEDFVRAVNDEYYNNNVRERLLGGVNEFERQRSLLGADGYMNYLFYGSSNKWEIVPKYGESYNEYCDNVIDFYRKRVEWIDSQMTESLSSGDNEENR